MSALDELAAIVALESPSRDKGACDLLARYLQDRLLEAGAEVALHANPAGGDHLEARFGSGDQPPALILGHYDTVWPVGTIGTRPFRIENDRAYGPGIFDMKTSLVLVELALRQILERPAPRPIVVLLTSDEEIGSRTSRDLIEQQARKSAYVLVLEPPLAPNVIKMRRKGTGNFRIDVEGRAAHAGLEPEKGISALVELAHQILRLTALSDPAKGTTVTVGVAKGGTVANVIPAAAEAVIDVRTWTRAEAERVSLAIQQLAPVVPGAKLRVTGGMNRPPLELTEPQENFFNRARAIGATLGIDLEYGEAGGGSDGNFTAALGIPTLDGLGCPGDGAHAEHEHILIDRLEPQARFLAALLTEL